MQTLKDKKLYYVGGVVRDEMLGIPSLDTDYCYEGDAIEFAKQKGLNIIRENEAFGTVRVLIEGNEIDIASTREEIYPEKGHLPFVSNIGSSLKKDLKRRDFTINAMAKRTTDGKIVDIFEGVKDLKEKKLRVLHNDSFIDDPTRILRGLKFSLRFGFELEKETRTFQEEYLNHINYDMSYHRLKKELIETFNLNRPEAYKKFIDEGIYKLLGADVKEPEFYPNFTNLNYSGKHIWLIYLAFFNLDNLELTRAEKRILEWAERLKSEKPTNNTPQESIIINNIYNEAVR